MNATRFFTDLDSYKNDNPVGATNLLTDVMSGPIKNSPWNVDAWNTYTSYVSQLSDPKQENAQHNIEAADKSMQRVYDQLKKSGTPQDEARLHTLESMAIANGYDLKTGKEFAQGNVKQDHERHEVTDTSGVVTPHLAVPARGTVKAVDIQTYRA